MASSETRSDRRVRVRLASADMEVTPASRCEVRVSVEWAGGELFEGGAAGTDTPEGRARAGASAAVAAMKRVTGDALRLEFRGIRSIRTFDEFVVIVSVRGHSAAERYDLIGSAVAPDGDLARGGILAVLDATNRILEKYAPQSSPPPP